MGVELKHYVEAIRQGWKVVLAVLVLALLAGVVLAFTQTREYEAQTKLFVANQLSSKDPDELSERNAIAQQRVLSYVEVVNGDVLASQVSRELGFRVDPDDVSASLASGTVVIDITVKDGDPRRAREVAAAYADLAPAAIRGVEPSDQGASKVDVSVIERARNGVLTGARSPILILVLTGLFGLAVGLVVATAAWVVRRELGAGGPAA